MSVTGPIDASDLGFVLPHEHILCDLLREYRGDGLLADPQLAVQELARFRESDGRTVVECSTMGGRDPVIMQEVSLRSGVNIVLGTGFYREPYLDREWLDRHPVEEISDRFVKELCTGIGETSIRAGVLGEIGCDRYITCAEERVFRAVAMAHRVTGALISTHAARWPVGVAQLDLLTQLGVDPSRIAIGHCDTIALPDYHEELAKRGAYVQFDTIQGTSVYEDEQRVAYVMNLVNKGFIDRILLSQDVCRRSMLKALGGCGYSYIATAFLPSLVAAGVSAEEVHQIIVINPQRALIGA